MYHSNLPDEVNSTRPKGMLDRDLRTTLTVRGGDVNHRNNQISSSDQYENCRNMCNNMRTAEVKRSDGYTYSCIHDQQLKDAERLWKDRRMSKLRLDRKYPSSRGFYRSLKRTKFGHCLLVFICIWLATIHRTCAYPVMSDEMDLSERCRAIKDALYNPIKQTNLTSDYIRRLLDNYTQAQFKKQPNELHAVWRHLPPHFEYDANFQPNEKVLLTDDFEGEAVASQLEHIQGDGIPTDDELKVEFLRIYGFLHTIKNVLHKILEDRRNNVSQILHDLNNDQNAHGDINKIFEEQSRYNDFEIKEVSTAMTALKIPHPHPPKSVVITNRTIEPITGEWIATREHLKILRYMKGVYNTFKNRCHL